MTIDKKKLSDAVEQVVLEYVETSGIDTGIFRSPVFTSRLSGWSWGWALEEDSTLFLMFSYNKNDMTYESWAFDNRVGWVSKSLSRRVEASKDPWGQFRINSGPIFEQIDSIVSILFEESRRRRAEQVRSPLVRVGPAKTASSPASVLPPSSPDFVATPAQTKVEPSDSGGGPLLMVALGILGAVVLWRR